MKCWLWLLILTAFVAPACAAEPLAALHDHDVILFQGDSITDGGRQRTGSDYNHIMGQSYAYLVAARLGADYPERNLVFINRGIGGNRVSDLAERWQTDTLDLKPNLLSILVGINDTLITNDAETVDSFQATFDQLLRQTRTTLPGTRIILGEPFLLPVGRHEADYAAELVAVQQRQQAVARLAAKYDLPLIHYQQAFDAACAKAPADHWSWDGVHPTYAGHGLMSELWIKTVKGPG